MKLLNRRFIDNTTDVIGILINIPETINITEVFNNCIKEMINGKFTALLLEDHIFIVIGRYNKFPFTNTYKDCSFIMSSLIKYSLNTYGIEHINDFNCEIFLSYNITDMVEYMESKRKRLSRKVLVKYFKQSGLAMSNITLKTHNNEQLLNLLEKTGINTSKIKDEMFGELYIVDPYTNEENSRKMVKFNNKTLKYIYSL